jgi:hypothetical protein
VFLLPAGLDIDFALVAALDFAHAFVLVAVTVLDFDFVRAVAALRTGSVQTVRCS